MTETAEAPPPPAPPPPATSIALEPFAFFPRRRSVIGGLGGDDPNADPTYAFHTHYVDCGIGAVAFTIRIADLAATCGTLTVRIHVLPADHSLEARVMKTAQIPLERLAEAGGEVAYRIVARPGMIYAAFGQVLDDTDVTASALAITLDAVDDDSIAVEDLVEARHSAFGSGAMRDAPHLLSQKPPSFAWPVAQLCTDGQFLEPDFGAVLRDLREDGKGDRHVWKRAVVLQALRRFGMLQPGATGAAIGSSGALPALAATADCSIVQVIDPTASTVDALEDLRRPAIIAPALSDAQLSVVAAPEPGVLPSELRGLDFLWSIGVIDACDTVAAAIEFVTRSTLRLAAGGVAIHTFDLRLDENDDPGEGEPHLILRRRHLERLAFLLLAARHDVCQIRYAGCRFGAYSRRPDPMLRSRRAVETIGAMRVTSFAIIARRGST